MRVEPRLQAFELALDTACAADHQFVLKNAKLHAGNQGRTIGWH
jgi:hypothetical protein